MAIIWFVIMIAGFYIATGYIRKVGDIEETYKMLANFGFMMVTVGAALFISYVSRLFKKK